MKITPAWSIYAAPFNVIACYSIYPWLLRLTTPYTFVSIGLITMAFNISLGVLAGWAAYGFSRDREDTKRNAHAFRQFHEMISDVNAELRSFQKRERGF